MEADTDTPGKYNITQTIARNITKIGEDLLKNTEEKPKLVTETLKLGVKHNKNHMTKEDIKEDPTVIF